MGNTPITLLKYVPLTVIVLVLFLISITGIVTIKTIGSIRYFGIMYRLSRHFRIGGYVSYCSEFYALSKKL